MSTQEAPIVSFLKEVMRRRKLLPSQLAADLGFSHATVSRWLSGDDIPSTRSCQRLSEYTGVPLERVLSIAVTCLKYVTGDLLSGLSLVSMPAGSIPTS